jgi:hypothetical protein
MCETFPERIPEKLIESEPFRKQALVPTMWQSIVTEYSKCQLTYAIDRLVAISGIARHMQQRNHDKYVAGMWKTKLEEQLCWMTTRPAPHRETTPYIAPTWSWAASSGPMTQWPRGAGDEVRPRTYCITILDIKLRYAGHDIFGALLSGMLRLVCNVLLSVRVEVTAQHLDKIIFAQTKRAIKAKVRFDTSEIERESGRIEFTALPVQSCVGWKGLGPMVVGLLLKISSEQPDTYQRVGLFEIQGETSEFDEAVAHAASVDQTNVAIQLI